MLKKARYKGQIVTVLRQADQHGLLYFVRLPTGEGVGVRAAELEDLSKEEQEQASQAPAPIQQTRNAIPPAYVGLKKKIQQFDPRNFQDFVEIMTLNYTLKVCDMNEMSSALNVTGSNLFSWTQGTLRPPPRVMMEAVRYIDSQIGSAIVRAQEEARHRKQNEVNRVDTEPEFRDTARSLGALSNASVQVMEVGGQTYTVEISESSGGLVARVPELSGIIVKADHQVDLMIDLKSQILNHQRGASLPPQGEEVLTDPNRKQVTVEVAQEPVTVSVPEEQLTTLDPEKEVPQGVVEIGTQVTESPPEIEPQFPDAPPADAHVEHILVEPDEPFEPKPSPVKTKYAKKLERDTSDSLNLLEKLATLKP